MAKSCFLTTSQSTDIGYWNCSLHPKTICFHFLTNPCNPLLQSRLAPGKLWQKALIQLEVTCRRTVSGFITVLFNFHLACSTLVYYYHCLLHSDSLLIGLVCKTSTREPRSLKHCRKSASAMIQEVRLEPIIFKPRKVNSINAMEHNMVWTREKSLFSLSNEWNFSDNITRSVLIQVHTGWQMIP